MNGFYTKSFETKFLNELEWALSEILLLIVSSVSGTIGNLPQFSFLA